ncbi:MAG: OmpH family outer membrane protein [Pseudomonadota bacterium]
MITLKRFTLAACLLLAATTVLADTKIGYVQADKVMQSAPQTVEVGKKLEKEFGARSTELQRLQKQVETQEVALEKDSLTLTESERNKRMRDISDFKMALERKQQEFNEDINIRKNEELAALQDKIKAAVASVAQSSGLDIVLFSGVAYASKQADITDSVLKAMSK